MNIKSTAIANVKAKLIVEQTKNKRKLDYNKYAMKKLVDEQTILKRELAEFGQLIRELGQPEQNA